MKRLLAIMAAMLLTLTACGTVTPLPPDTSTPPAQSITPTSEVSPPTTPATPVIPDGAFVFTPENMPRIDGSTATIPLIEAVYSVMLGIPRDEAAVMVNTTGTDNAYSALMDGRADILLVYSPSPDTLYWSEQSGKELEMVPIGRDGLVFLVNIVNPVASLTPEQIVSIYTNETTNWKDFGGDDVEIMAFQRPYRSGSQTMMDALVMKGIPMAETALEYVIGEMGGLINAVAAYDNANAAIGYNVFYFVTQMEMDENVKLLSIGGVAPTVETISDGSYPFVSDFHAVILKDAPEGSPERVLFDWIQSADGRALVKHEGYATAD